MYLEISGRCSGKSTRLREHVIKLAEKKCAVIVTFMNNHLFYEFLRTIQVKHQRFIFNGRSRNVEKIVESRNFSKDDIYYCYDEFDYYKDGSIVISQNGYYCTTAVFARTENHYNRWIENNKEGDALLSLLRENGGKYVSYTSDLLYNKCYISSYTNEDYNREICGNFLYMVDESEDEKNETRNIEWW